MADVKLFHVTEFAESMLQSPQSHRSAIHPLWASLLVALWIATVGHWPLWQTMVFQTEPGSIRPTLTLLLAAQIGLGALFWVALTGWRWLFKPAVTALLVWAALGCCAMGVQLANGEAVAMSPGGLLQFVSQPVNWGRMLNGPCLLNVLVIAVVPATLIWRGRIRRMSATSRILMNAGLLVAVYVLLRWSLGLAGHALPSPLDPMGAFHLLRLM
jgi:glucan phosphoethanolaminetransferase (alkaline phosphatase superfamily)